MVLSVGDTNPTWQRAGALILRNAHVGALQAIMPDATDDSVLHAWRVTATDGSYGALPVDLANFTYDRLGGYGESSDTDVTRIQPDGLIRWIEQSVPPGHAAKEGYVPQPYMQLARTLRADGAGAAADAVDFARLKHRMQTREGWWSWLGDAAAWLFVGFGVYPERALFWFAGLVGVGWLVTYGSSGMKGKGPFERFFYSLENAVPLIDLSQGFEDVSHGDNRAVANFFHFQKIAGFLLATVLVGALTLLAG